jgi:hypothetical protein
MTRCRLAYLRWSGHSGGRCRNWFWRGCGCFCGSDDSGGWFRGRCWSNHGRRCRRSYFNGRGLRGGLDYRSLRGCALCDYGGFLRRWSRRSSGFWRRKGLCRGSSGGSRVFVVIRRQRQTGNGMHPIVLLLGFHNERRYRCGREKNSGECRKRTDFEAHDRPRLRANALPLQRENVLWRHQNADLGHKVTSRHL